MADERVYTKADMEAACELAIAARLRGGVVVPEEQIKLIWKAAMTAAANVCIDRSNRHNGNDDSERCEEANDCSHAIQTWIEPDEGHLQEMQSMLAAAKEGKS